ncbi:MULTISPECIES: 5-methyltetrahydropteroyltriglutamate--homocysteine S-methyltransferase [unclassified Agarivorans]|uniref:5-methyltetrahydropteroyltriglutamate-- homocysteine S-methyltransferase n=1 Tax=unclassified Agarivorans TaxID=2636026 RepID=UPI0026E1B9FB|nr:MULTISPECIES: 5-methyltetrahydropteroyltriglutamate--homocysteine S-methyltransferase [unclassified Agarivorans]MDO6685170.1 5-methyltetrahydropteroyltriglutamate--homocysteine S-methyltransferase [Agarivorans sp. 3_MG-2023]MDO6715658.1 5-methyltetrahydropteroyltriglutamate--homocysteine S-methyltransferase [Agarivorans sp. 2_MG-2023]
MSITHVLGYPRIGKQRELKFALESYWRGESSQQQLLEVGKTIRQQNWQAQQDSGQAWVTVGDFAWYDQVLNTSLLLGNVPKRHQSDEITLDSTFAVARGQQGCGCNHAASDMSKWFNTNYHYIVPEFSEKTEFSLQWQQLFDEIKEALALGHEVKPVILGPVSYLYLGKNDDAAEDGFQRISLLPQLLTVYREIFQKIADLGIEWVQVDEPVLGLELEPQWQAALLDAYSTRISSSKLLLTSYFADVLYNAEVIKQLAVDGLHLDLSAAPEQLEQVLTWLPEHWVLSAGVVNGRNVWRANLPQLIEQYSSLKVRLGERLWFASSCSLLHSPLDLESETDLGDAKFRLAFAEQKLTELQILDDALNGDADALRLSRQYSAALQSLSNQKNTELQQRIEQLAPEQRERKLAFTQRQAIQQQSLQLPPLPTTTIGSFPQTNEIRRQRREYKAGELSQVDYDAALAKHIADAIERQEKLGLDVLVHGEAERNDMVEYFAELLDGFIASRFGWVQSYGSRCVKPAIIVDDIERSKPLTLEWTNYAQSLTNKPVKGMLTGPVTILTWSFAREDISRAEIAEQIALALNDEVAELQQAGIQVIQIDEPAIREGMPLKRSEWQHYLDWAVSAFKLSAASAQPETQIHTHMCYSEFNDIMPSVAALDADVLTIETSRSAMSLLQAFEHFEYPNEIGPGVYDIHSPNIPSIADIKGLIDKAAEWIPHQRLWVNPDCGLKTRNWEETEAALKNMVLATKELRASLV